MVDQKYYLVQTILFLKKDNIIYIYIQKNLILITLKTELLLLSTIRKKGFLRNAYKSPGYIL